MPYLSTMLGKKVEDTSGRVLGYLADVVAGGPARFPLVKGVLVRSGRKANASEFFIPWSDVADLLHDRIVVKRSGEGKPPAEGDIFLARDVLDKQIVDMDGYKIVRVTDIRLAGSPGQMRVIGADIGMLAFLRRLGLGGLAERLKSERVLEKDRMVPWHLVSPVEPMPYDVRLRVPYREFLQKHPSDVADVIEQLDEEKRAKVFALIDDPMAAEVLARVLPGVRSEVAGSIDDERLSDLLEIMPPDEAADILGSLPREKAQTLLSLMGIEEAEIIRELLGYEPTSAGGRMTTEFLAVPDYYTADETIEYLRTAGEEAETIYYIYVVDREGHLSGVLSLRDLLRASPSTTCGEIMRRDVITVDVQDDQEIVADRLSRYNLLALPVVDEDHVLKGIVTVDDAIDVMMEETSEDISQLSGVPTALDRAASGDTLNIRRWTGTMLTFLGGLLATLLFGVFKAEFVVALAIVYFLPLALRASHDVSMWSLAMAVRDIKGEELGHLKKSRVLAREYLNALGAAGFISVTGLLLGLIWTGPTISALAAAVGLFIGITLAGILGIAVPISVRKSHPDPALGSGRILGLLVMAVSMISFLVVAGLMVGAWR